MKNKTKMSKTNMPIADLSPVNEASVPRVSATTWSPKSRGQEAAQMGPCGLIHAVTHSIATWTELHINWHINISFAYLRTFMHSMFPTPSWGVTSAEEDSQALQWENWSAICCSRTPATDPSFTAQPPAGASHLRLCSASLLQFITSSI